MGVKMLPEFEVDEARIFAHGPDEATLSLGACDAFDVFQCLRLIE
jgi:hypothetical protein